MLLKRGCEAMPLGCEKTTGITRMCVLWSARALSGKMIYVQSSLLYKLYRA